MPALLSVEHSDNTDMMISGTSIVSVSNNIMTSRSDMQIRMQISSGGLKKQINQHKVQTVAFGRMMKNSSIDGTGMLVDIYV